MLKYNFLIVEDDEKTSQKISDLLHARHKAIVADVEMAASYEEAEVLLSKKRFDVTILDIGLKRRMSYGLLDDYRDSMGIIAFATVLTEIDTDYLVKAQPALFLNKHADEGTAFALQQCLENLNRVQQVFVEKYDFHVGDKPVYLRPSAVNYCMSRSKALEAGYQVKQGGCIVFYFDSFEEKLVPLVVNESMQDFIDQAHKKTHLRFGKHWILNLLRIQEYNGTSHTVMFLDGSELCLNVKEKLHEKEEELQRQLAELKSQGITHFTV